MINSLFKLDILKIYQCPELEGLSNELENLDIDQSKSKIKDDFVDALRYALMGIPVNWEEIFKKKREGVIVKDTYNDMVRELRPRDAEENNRLIFNEGYESEFSEWNDLY